MSKKETEPKYDFLTEVKTKTKRLIEQQRLLIKEAKTNINPLIPLINEIRSLVNEYNRVNPYSVVFFGFGNFTPEIRFNCQSVEKAQKTCFDLISLIPDLSKFTRSYSDGGDKLNWYWVAKSPRFVKGEIRVYPADPDPDCQIIETQNRYTTRSCKRRD